MTDDATTPSEDALDRALQETEVAVGQALDDIFDPHAGLEQIKNRLRRAAQAPGENLPEPRRATGPQAHDPSRQRTTSPQPTRRPPSPQQSAVAKTKILLVDDRPENLLALEAVLSSLDQTLVRASSGEEALKALLTDDFAVILLDVQMPGMGGFETAAHIKRHERTRGIPIILLSAVNHGPHHTFRGYAAGAVDYISKPFDAWTLRAKVSVFVDLYRTDQQLHERAALLRMQLQQRDDPQAADTVLAELSVRLKAVEKEAEMLSKQLDDNSTSGSVVATVAQLARRITHLRRAVDALGPGAAARENTKLGRS